MNTALIILAAGYSTRARNDSQNKQKCLIEYNGATVLKNNLDIFLHSDDIRQVILGLGYDASSVIEYCLKYYPKVEFTFSIEKVNDLFSTGNTFKKSFQKINFGKIQKVIVSFSDYYYLKYESLYKFMDSNNSIGIYKEQMSNFDTFSGSFKTLAILDDKQKYVNKLIVNPNELKKTNGFMGLFTFTNISIMNTLLDKITHIDYTFDVVNNYIKMFDEEMCYTEISGIIDFGDLSNFNNFVYASSNK